MYTHTYTHTHTLTLTHTHGNKCLCLLEDAGEEEEEQRVGGANVDASAGGFPSLLETHSLRQTTFLFFLFF